MCDTLELGIRSVVWEDWFCQISWQYVLRRRLVMPPPPLSLSLSLSLSFPFPIPRPPLVLVHVLQLMWLPCKRSMNIHAHTHAHTKLCTTLRHVDISARHAVSEFLFSILLLWIGSYCLVLLFCPQEKTLMKIQPFFSLPCSAGQRASPGDTSHVHDFQRWALRRFTLAWSFWRELRQSWMSTFWCKHHLGVFFSFLSFSSSALPFPISFSPPLPHFSLLLFLLLFLPMSDPHRYQLRVYLYQARNVRSSDQSGLSGVCILSQVVIKHSK